MPGFAGCTHVDKVQVRFVHMHCVVAGCIRFVIHSISSEESTKESMEECMYGTTVSLFYSI